VSGIASPASDAAERPRGAAGMVILLALDAVLKIQLRARVER
jgi:hypothetical protein